jgi:hypothetical protein
MKDIYAKRRQLWCWLANNAGGNRRLNVLFERLDAQLKVHHARNHGK